jgi:arylformamidase
MHMSEGPSRLILLSHTIDPAGPAWPGSPGLQIEPVKRIDAGGTSNTSLVHLYSHLGTHVDAPRHFISDGKTVADLPIDAFVFDRPAVVDLPLGDGALVRAEDLDTRLGSIGDADLVIIRSGFESARSDRARYEQRGPGFSVDAARFIRSRLPAVRGIAVDFISLSAYANADEGRAAHRVLLADQPSGRPVLIFEDVRVSALGTRVPRRVLALPLMIAGLDGCPCTIVAEV